ncbi:ABC transporter substrate-binding protein [Candidatus Margulisiibacteriota bacterium]
MYAQNDLRIVSVSPAVTEIIYALNAQKHLVGITNNCDFPEACTRLPKIGTFLKPVSEKILILDPTLIIGSGNQSAPQIKLFNRLGIETIIFPSPKNFTDIYTMILKIGKLTKRSAKAHSLVSSMKKDINKLRKHRENVQDPPSVLFVVWAKPLICAGQKTFINSLIVAAGAKNIVADSLNSYPRISLESIIKNNPDFIICEKEHLKILSEYPVLKDLPIIQNPSRQICDINPDLLLRPGPRFILGLNMLKNKISKGLR